MASKLQIITAMFNDEVGKVTSNLDNWTSFLRTASNNFKYNFVEQMLIYTQNRPHGISREGGYFLLYYPFFAKTLAFGYFRFEK